MLGDSSSAHSGALGSWEKSYKVKQGVKPDNYQGNKFLIGLMVVNPNLLCQVGKSEGISSCYLHLRY